MARRDGLQERIRAELAAHPKVDVTALTRLVSKGAERSALEEIFFFTEPSSFLDLCHGILREMDNAFLSSSEDHQEQILRFLSELSLWAQSYLPEWRLLSARMHEDDVVNNIQLKDLAAETASRCMRLSRDADMPTGRLMASWRKDVAARFAAEGVPDSRGEAVAFVGTSLESYQRKMAAAMATSNVQRVAQMHARGETLTEISNDYAAFLDYAMLLGASFVTCNPPLVDIAWVADPERWDPVVDEIVRGSPGATAAALAAKVTLEIVLSNMRMLRPVFLLTEGHTGYVSLQVNPKNHDRAGAMISEAESIYRDLEGKLGGGVPNVVFKLPATHAGLIACRALTAQGIGVNITVNFGMFQHLRFAEAIREGNALVSTITHMSGRLAFPVRDELLGKLDGLAEDGIDEVRAREAAAWSGVAVLKRLHFLLKSRGYDLGRVKPLVASLRVYGGKGYEALPTPVPDISEVIGTGIITIFPNVRHAFDALLPMELDPRRVETPVPDRVLEVLRHSEVFKQAYHIGNPDWLEEEDGRFRPDRILRLEDEAAVVEWLPVKNTIAEFCASYDAFLKRIESRAAITGKPLR